jgi:hypothetical protein
VNAAVSSITTTHEDLLRKFIAAPFRSMGEPKSRDMNSYILSRKCEHEMNWLWKVLRPDGSGRLTEIATRDEVR